MNRGGRRLATPVGHSPGDPPRPSRRYRVGQRDDVGWPSPSQRTPSPDGDVSLRPRRIPSVSEARARSSLAISNHAMARAAPGPSRRRVRSGQGVGEAGANDGAGGSGAATGCHVPSAHPAGGRVGCCHRPSRSQGATWSSGSSGVEAIRMLASRVPSGDQRGESRTASASSSSSTLVAAVSVDDPRASGARPAVPVFRWVHSAVEGELLSVWRPRRVAAAGLVASSTSRRCPEPSASTTNMPSGPGAASSVPSGDHAGHALRSARFGPSSGPIRCAWSPPARASLAATLRPRTDRCWHSPRCPGRRAASRPGTSAAYRLFVPGLSSRVAGDEPSAATMKRSYPPAAGPGRGR